MSQAIAANIPIRIKNTFAPKLPGTLIIPNPRIDLESSPPPSPEGMNRHCATAVTVKEGMTVCNVRSNRRSASHGFLARIFSLLDSFNLVADLISISEVHVSMVISSEMPESLVSEVCVSY
jgi:aspartate kinase